MIHSSRVNAPVQAPIFDRSALRAGDEIVGPAAIEEAATTTFIDVGDRLRADETGFLIIDVAADEPQQYAAAEGSRA